MLDYQRNRDLFFEWHRAGIRSAKRDVMITNSPPFIRQCSLLSALIGGFIGVLISWSDGDDLGWSLLRGALLVLAFGTVSRWWLQAMATAWLESRIESLQSSLKAIEPQPNKLTR